MKTGSGVGAIIGLPRLMVHLSLSLSQIPLPTISGRVMQLLLKYLYTGQCLFPRDDLNLGIELMAAADQFLLEPMKIQCERALSEKIDNEVSALCKIFENFSKHLSKP